MPDARWLDAQAAAEYIRMSTEGFRRAVRRGVMPVASYKLGPQSPRWDRLALDRAMGAEDAADHLGEAVHAIREKIRREAQDRQKAAR